MKSIKKTSSTPLFITLVVILVLFSFSPKTYAQFGEVIIGAGLVVELVEDDEVGELIEDYVKAELKKLLEDIKAELLTKTSKGITIDNTGIYVLIGNGLLNYDMAYIPFNPDGSMPTDSTGRQLIENVLGSAGEGLAWDVHNDWVLATKNNIDAEVRAFKASDLRAGNQNPETHLYTAVGGYNQGIDCFNGITYFATSDKLWIGRFHKSGDNYEKKKYTKYDVPGNPHDVAVDANGILFVTSTYNDKDILVQYSVGTDGKSLIELTRWDLGVKNTYWGVAADGYLVYVINQTDNCMDVFDYNGTLLLTATFPADSISPYYVQVSGNYVYVTDDSTVGDTQQVLHIMQLSASKRQIIASGGLQATSDKRSALQGLPTDAELHLTANLAVAIDGNNLNLQVQFRESNDLTTWTNVGSPIQLNIPVPTDYSSLFYCLTSGQSVEEE